MTICSSRAAGLIYLMLSRSFISIETDYGINFSDIGFDLTRLDSISAIAALVGQPSAELA